MIMENNNDVGGKNEEGRKKENNEGQGIKRRQEKGVKKEEERVKNGAVSPEKDQKSLVLREGLVFTIFMITFRYHLPISVLVQCILCVRSLFRAFFYYTSVWPLPTIFLPFLCMPIAYFHFPRAQFRTLSSHDSYWLSL